MKSEHFQLVSGAFAFGVGFDANFGIHPADRRRALEYFNAMHLAGLDWPDIEFDIRSFCEERQRSDAGQQIENAKKLWISLKTH